MAILVVGTGCKHLAYELSQTLGMNWIEAHIHPFSDGELHVQLPTPLYNEDALVLQSTANPSNENMMTLVLLLDAVKRAGARRIWAVVPYLAYSRQDKPSCPWGSLSARVIATILEAVKLDCLLTLELHSPQSQGFFKIGLHTIDPIPLFSKVIPDPENWTIVSPDMGGAARARRLAAHFKTDVIILDKKGPPPTKTLIENLRNKKCLILDDIADTGATVCQAARLLKAHGATLCDAAIVHGVLSGKAETLLQESDLQRIFITNSIPHASLLSKFHSIDITPLLAQAVRESLFPCQL